LATLKKILMFPHECALTAFGLEPTMFEFLLSLKGEIMRLYRLAMCLAVIGLTMSFGYSTSQAQALPSLACAVGLNVHPGARILLHHHTIAQCTGAAGCKCVSCYNFNGSVSALCFPLVTPIPFAAR
jgi:hypothetical protein